MKVASALEGLSIHQGLIRRFIDSVGLPCRVLARDLKMPVQNINSKVSTRPELGTNLLQILIPTTFNSLLGEKGQLTHQPCPRTGFGGKILDFTT